MGELRTMLRGVYAVAAATVVALAFAAPAHAVISCDPSSVALPDVHPGAAVSGSLGCADDDGESLSYGVSSPATLGYGSVDYFSGELGYQAPYATTGHDAFTVTVDDLVTGADGTADDPSVDVPVGVDVTNHAPTCTTLSLGSVHTAQTATGQLDCTDPDSDTLSYTVEPAGAAANGIGYVDFGSGAVGYISNATYAGPDSFAVTVSDGNGGATVSTVSVTVTNSAPQCTAASVGSVHTGQTATGQLSCTDDDGDPLSYAVADGGQAAHGNGYVDYSTGALTYISTEAYAGPDAFDVTVSDGLGGTRTVTVAVTVTNAKPACSALALDPVHAGQTVTGTVSCTDADGDLVGYSIDTAPQHGNAYVDYYSGALSYVPDAYAGPDSFKIAAGDGFGGITVANVTVTVVNAKPVCQTLAMGSVAPDQTTYGTPPCTDADGDPLTIVTRSQPAHGVAEASFGSLVYTAGHGYTGADSFTFGATDGIEPSQTATANVTIVNHPPQCSDAEQTIRTGKPFTADPSCFDEDGNAFTLSVSRQPGHGTAAIVTDEGGGQRYRYTPASGFTGDDSFDVQAFDGTDQSAPATITLHLTPNHAPRCETFTTHTKVATAVSLSLFCSDEDWQDSGALAYALTTPAPAHGATSNFDQSFGFATLTYTPDAGYTGADAVAFTASDGDLTTTATQPLHVADGPFCDPLPARQVRPGRTFFGSLACTYPSGPIGSISFAIVAPPSQGTATINSFSGGYSYRAGDAAAGADSFGIRIATTQAGNSNLVTQTVDVTPSANEPPACGATGTQVVYAERAWTLFTNCGDQDFDPLIVATNGAPAHGTSTVSDGQLRYTGDAGYTGSDTVPFTVSDGRAAPVAGSITVDVRAPEKPTCSAVPAISLRPSQVKHFNLFCHNPQGDPQTYDVSRQGSQGTAAIDSIGGGTYTALASGAGTDTFDVRALDAVGTSAPVTVSVDVSPTANVAPTCNGNSFFFPLKVATGTTTTLPLAGYCSDADGDPLTFTRVSSPANGTVPPGPAGSLSYTSNAGFLGGDSFTFRASDDRGTSSGTVSFFVTVVQSIKPSCVQRSAVALRPSQQKAFSLSCSDPNGGQISYEIVSGPSKGTLSPSGTSLSATRTYTAGATAPDTDTFTYRATSASGTSDTYTQSFDITQSANVAPGCGSSSSAFPSLLPAGRASTVSSLCFDQDGDALTYTGGTAPAHGTVSYTGGTISYTPSAGYTGDDSFSYSVSDGRPGGTAGPVTQYVHVYAPVPPSCASPTALDVRKNSSGRTIPFACSDSQFASVSYVIDTGPSHGTLSPTGPSIFASRTYRPDTDYTGDDTIVWHAESVNGSSPAQSQVIHVTDTANTAPSCPATAQAITARPGVARTLPIVCSDVDGDLLTPSVGTAPAHGTLAFPTGTAPTYTATDGYTGSDAFTVAVSDGHGGTNSVAFSVTVSTTNHPPVCFGTSITATSGQTYTFSGPPPCTDEDGDAVTLAVVTGPAHGVVGTGAGGAPTYTPTAGYTGPDSFTYKGNDGFADSAVQTVTITVVNPPGPACSSLARSVTAGLTLDITLSCSGAPGGGALSYEIVAGPPAAEGSLGTINQATGMVRFTPATGFAGQTSFTYRAHQGTDTSAPATVTIDVNQPPTASIDGPSTALRGVAVTLTGTDGDVDGTIQSRAWDIDGDGFDDGTGTSVSPTFTTLGAHDVRYRVTDSDGAQTTAEKVVKVVNRPPTALIDGPASTHRGEPVTLTLTDADADGTVVSRAWDTDSDGQFDDGTGTSVSPALSGTAGAKTVRVRVTDDDGGVTTATKTVTLLNRPPVAGFTFAPAAPKAGQVVTLTSSATDDASIARQEWDLDGDGAYDDHTGPTATVTFPAAGTKTVALKVTDSDGAPATATKTIAVAPADTTGGGGGGGGGGGADTTPPHLTLTPVAGQKLRTVGAGGLKLSAGADEACTLTILLRIDKKTAKALKLGKKALVVGSLTTPLSGARTIVTVKLTSKAAKAFKKAKKPVKLAIAATATDPSANTAKLSASVSLKK